MHNVPIFFSVYFQINSFSIPFYYILLHTLNIIDFMYKENLPKLFINVIIIHAALYY
jgi:hypothetical protein